MSGLWVVQNHGWKSMWWTPFIMWPCPILFFMTMIIF
jgi:hypothetical protein